jgi:hypothetical protein
MTFAYLFFFFYLLYGCNSHCGAHGGGVLVDGAVHPRHVAAHILRLLLDPEELPHTVRHRVRAPHSVTLCTRNWTH